MNVIEFETEEACINYVGKRTIFKFSFAADGLLCYETVKPITISGEYYNFTTKIFQADSEFFDFETLGDLLFKHKLFELKRVNIATQETETLYHKKYDA